MKKYDTHPIDQLFTLPFKYVYGMSSQEQLDYCLLRLPPGSRVSLSATHSARWLSYQIDHLTRTLNSGRGTGSFADNLYSSENSILSIIKPTMSFVGEAIEFPIPTSYKGNR